MLLDQLQTNVVTSMKSGDKTRTETFIILNFTKGFVLIGGTAYAGEIKRRSVDSMISMSMGKALSFALWMLQERGLLYIGPGVDVYEGQVVGNTSKGIEMMVNPTKNKAMSNFRNARNDEEINLNPPYELTIERGFEIMAGDEFLEITPKNVRLRKELLTEVERTRNKRQKNKE